MPNQHKHGSRLAIVFSGSPLFTGGAGSGESDIRRWIIENDWLEAVIALPEQMFYNTGIGTYISRKTAAAGWGKGTVLALAAYIQKRQPGVRGFSPQNLWRMRQFHDAYRDQPKLSTLLRELPWSSNLNFYLEALDRDVRKPHERPAIGLLLCATKDTEVVEYCLSRSLSPAMIAEYETMLPDKDLLKAKLHELYHLLAPAEEEEEAAPDRKPKVAPVPRPLKKRGRK
ncbi:MAG: PDDEXK nuclease domain-containing protein [Terrimicrobiaceae bacterium]